VCGTSWFPVAELSQRLKQKSVKNPVTKVNEYQREYQQICKQTPRFTIGDCAGGHRADNRDKNRDVLIVPREFQLELRTNAYNSNKIAFRRRTNQYPFLCCSGQFSTVSYQFSRQQFYGLYKCRFRRRKSIKINYPTNSFLSRMELKTKLFSKIFLRNIPLYVT